MPTPPRDFTGLSHCLACYLRPLLTNENNCVINKSQGLLFCYSSCSCVSFLFFWGVLCFLFPSLFTTHSSCVTFPRNLCFNSVLFQQKVVNCSYSVKLEVCVFSILKKCLSEQAGAEQSKQSLAAFHVCQRQG